ncbi:hypothetical protein FIBSPDRAFT_875027 [Athelia psychrophila]|uniref:Uncharacterized protein n=1 Tax=Athelia psychrophila TaxID=1759441 RepID=A0A165WRN9_9AGAM|nr:hypothetical protein FIBSPDRAFT_875027 [Fibularhizoctonia sp. CBS 109695]
MTGRQLSLVSKFTRAASAPVKYQSIAAHGPRQITAFHQLLLQTPPHLRHIKYLFLSTLLPPSSEREEQLSEAGRGVLTAVAESVEILYLNLPYDFNLWYLPTTSFPRLVELASHGFPINRKSPYDLIEQDITPFPQLLRWYYMHTAFIHIPALNPHDLADIHITAPMLTHLRLSINEEESYLPSALKASLPDTIQLVYVKPKAPYARWPASDYRALMRGLEELNEADSRLVLLPAYTTHENPMYLVLGDWEERISGGDGCWSLRERILADSSVPAPDSK